jgi:twinkle protein
LKKALPFGSHAFPRTGRSIVVTEGEIDAMSMSQVQGNKWPVVSIACGADKPEDDEGNPMPMNKVRKYFGTHRDYFLGFEKVILMFDNDGPGIASARVAADIIGPSAHIATLPLKDANEMLLANRVQELVDAMWRAKKHSPDGIVTSADVREEVMKGVPLGVPWPWESLTKLTHGRRRGEVYTIGAGTGVGKTHFLLQLVVQTLMELHESVGCIFLEQQPRETMQRLLGIMDGVPYHLPEHWDAEKVGIAYDKLETEGASLFLYDRFGSATWETIERRIRYLATVEGCHHIVLDHLTALAAAEDDERKALERIMKDVSELVTELDITLYLVSHLATPDGKPHEEGGRVMIRHFKGSRAIGFWSHYMIGLERNQQADSQEERTTTTVRLLKARYDGSKTGRTVMMRFDEDTNLLLETGDGPPQMFPSDTDEITAPADDVGVSDF